MPSCSPRIIRTGHLIFVGSQIGSREHISTYVPVGTELHIASSRSANASATPSSEVPGLSLVKIDRKKSRSTDRKFLEVHWSIFFVRSVKVGEPSPVHTNASRMSLLTEFGKASANAAARRAPARLLAEESQSGPARSTPSLSAPAHAGHPLSRAT